MNLFINFLSIFSIVYVVSLGVYFITGFLISAINKCSPQNRIQKKRDGEKRARIEIKSSIKALAVSSVLLSAGYLFQQQGWALFQPFELNWWNFAVFFVLAFVIFDAWFYWGHRILHLKWFYRWHKPHHLSVAPTAWSNDSSAVVDTLIEHGFYFFVWLLLPIPAISVFALRLFDQVSGMIGHSGFEYFAGRTTRRPFPFLCTTFHDLHHSQFHYNFGNFMSVWDRMMGTVHPKYDQIVFEIEETGIIPDEGFMRANKTG